MGREVIFRPCCSRSRTRSEMLRWHSTVAMPSNSPSWVMTIDWDWFGFELVLDVADVDVVNNFLDCRLVAVLVGCELFLIGEVTSMSSIKSINSALWFLFWVFS